MADLIPADATLLAHCKGEKHRSNLLRMNMGEKSLIFYVTLLLLLHTSLADEEPQGGSQAAHREEIEPVTEILFPWFANILGVISFFLLARYCHMFPYTAVMFILGTCMGVGYARLGGQSQLHESLAIWESIDGERLLLIFLPGLLFKDSFCSNVHLMALAFSQCLVMAL